LPLFSDNKDSDTVKRINLGGDEPLFVIGMNDINDDAFIEVVTE